MFERSTIDEMGQSILLTPENGTEKESLNLLAEKDNGNTILPF
jgi:hypothetical protein